MQHPEATDLALLLFIRLNRKISIRQVDLMIAKGLAHKLPLDDIRITLTLCGEAYALTEAGNDLLDNR